jgi:hypothetical protein
MFEIHTDIEIEATPEHVWDVLLNFRAYPSRLFIPGVFDGDHRFVIEPLSKGRARLRQSERFSGILARLLRRTLERDTRGGFTEMNAELKRLAEGKGRT